MAQATEALPARRSLRDVIEGRWFPYIMVAPTLLVLALVAVIPFVFTIFVSFQDARFAQLAGFHGATNYATLITDWLFWRALLLTGLIMIVAIPLQFAIGLGIALLMHRGVFAGRLIAPILLLPTVVAPTVVAIVWKIQLAGTWGFFTYAVIDRFQLISQGSVLSVPGTALATIILVDVWQWTPFVSLALFAGLQALPVSPYRAAAVDGASAWHVFRYLTLPMLAPLIAVLLLLRVLDTFKIFDAVFVLTGGGPGRATEVLGIYLYRTVFQFWELGRAAAGAALIFVMFLVFSSVLYKLLTRRLHLL